MSHTRWYQTGKETFIQAIKMVGKINLTTLKQNTGRHFRRGERLIHSICEHIAPIKVKPLPNRRGREIERLSFSMFIIQK